MLILCIYESENFQKSVSSGVLYTHIIIIYSSELVACPFCHCFFFIFYFFFYHTRAPVIYRQTFHPGRPPNNIFYLSSAREYYKRIRARRLPYDGLTHYIMWTRTNCRGECREKERVREGESDPNVYFMYCHFGAIVSNVHVYKTP